MRDSAGVSPASLFPGHLPHVAGPGEANSEEDSMYPRQPPSTSVFGANAEGHGERDLLTFADNKDLDGLAGLVSPDLCD